MVVEARGPIGWKCVTKADCGPSAAQCSCTYGRCQCPSIYDSGHRDAPAWIPGPPPASI